MTLRKIKDNNQNTGFVISENEMLHLEDLCRLMLGYKQTTYYVSLMESLLEKIKKRNPNRQI